jgi:hypothetical protein
MPAQISPNVPAKNTKVLRRHVTDLTRWKSRQVNSARESEACDGVNRHDLQFFLAIFENFAGQIS